MILYFCLKSIIFKVTKTTINFREGQYHQFKIKKHIEISHTEKYFIVEDQAGKKQLLNSDYYKKYKFETGQLINCRIDHINCSGKIFLEPVHPFYAEGENYDFVINEIDYKKNKFEDNILVIRVFDAIGNEALCIIENEISDNFTIGQNISCKVERIKKGKLYLSFSSQKTLANFIRGEYYKFVIEDIKVLSDNYKYYILIDDKNRKYLLKHEYYKNHNLKIGQNIECTIIKYSSKGYYVLEPRHPDYEIEKAYVFNFLKQKKDLQANITGNFEITVGDTFDNEIIFISNKSILSDGKEPEKIKCKVTGIKKGKPLLSLSH